MASAYPLRLHLGVVYTLVMALTLGEDRVTAQMVVGSPDGLVSIQMRPFVMSSSAWIRARSSVKGK